MYSPFIRINCYKQITEWPHLKKDEILEVVKLSIKKVVKEQNFEGMFNERYKQIKKISEGADSITYQVEDIQDNNKFKALKKFNPIISDIYEKIDFESEFDIIKRLSNQNKYLTSYLDIFSKLITDEYKVLFVITEFCEYSLKDEIQNKRIFNDKIEIGDIQKWTIELLNGIEFLHSNNFIHQSFMPSHIFIKHRSIVIGNLIPDFSKYFESNSSNSLYDSSEIISYTAPEKYSSHKTEKMNIWYF